MAVEIRAKYTGNLKVDLAHGPSGGSLRTSAPVDNMGDGSSFSPTDLVAAALASCAITTMGIVAGRENIPFEHAEAVIEKHMRSTPRRVDRLPIRIRMPAGLSHDQRKVLEDAARHCPVARSLASDIRQEFTFEYA